MLEWIAENTPDITSSTSSMYFTLKLNQLDALLHQYLPFVTHQIAALIIGEFMTYDMRLAQFIPLSITKFILKPISSHPFSPSP
jgi:hypothetical protein